MTQIDLYTSGGQKSGTLALPATLFTGEINQGLMHQAVLMQQGNRRRPIAHVKTRGEVVGSTKKLFQQKHTGRARRGPIRSPLMKGGGKAFGPRNDANFTRAMPKKMRHAALRSCLSLQAKNGAVVALESYPDTVKTKSMAQLLAKLPLKSSRKVLIVHAGEHKGISLSARNIRGVKPLSAAYLNPEDVLNATAIVFLKDGLEKAEVVFGRKTTEIGAPRAAEQKEEGEEKKAKKPAAKKAAKTKTAAKPKKTSSSSK